MDQLLHSLAVAIVAIPPTPQSKPEAGCMFVHCTHLLMNYIQADTSLAAGELDQ
jgi:hypothetical protein